MVMLRTMMFFELPPIEIPKFALEPFAPWMVMSLLSLISTTFGSLRHYAQGSVMLAKLNWPV
jgi:hypothetical protein